MKPLTASISLLSVNAESASLEASGLIALYEIDVTTIATTETLAKAFRFIDFSYNLDALQDKTFRFHNNLKLIDKNIIFGGKTFGALPIQMSGFETSSNGTIPAPKLLMTSASDVGDSLFANLKMFVRYLNGLVGAKVTRTRTFLKHIDAENFYSNWNTSLNCALQNGLTLVNEQLVPPKDFCPDPNAIFPKDVFYVDRKSSESKTSIELELGSLIDVQGAVLPARMVIERKCSWQYRGEGCCYEFEGNRSSVHGEASLPRFASPVANEKDELISTVIINFGATTFDPQLWSATLVYTKGAVVRINVDGINYYFIAKDNVPKFAAPPNEKYWMADQCSKTIKGCKLRWQNNTTFNGFLPFGGFPGIQARG